VRQRAGHHPLDPAGTGRRGDQTRHRPRHFAALGWAHFKKMSTSNPMVCAGGSTAKPDPLGVPHFTLKHASWLNQIEIWFSSSSVAATSNPRATWPAGSAISSTTSTKPWPNHSVGHIKTRPPPFDHEVRPRAASLFLLSRTRPLLYIPPGILIGCAACHFAGDGAVASGRIPNGSSPVPGDGFRCRTWPQNR